jgi:UPF0716 protein FxsA
MYEPMRQPVSAQPERKTEKHVRFAFALLFLLLPLLEIATFVLVGSEIGALNTIGLVLLSGVAGAMLMRWQGLGLLTRIRREVDAGNSPGREIVHGTMILVAGILLVIPGFLTDIAGLVLFLPPVRDFVWRHVKSRITVVSAAAGAAGFRTRRDNGRTIDLDEEEFARNPGRDDEESPWRRPELK